MWEENHQLYLKQLDNVFLPNNVLLGVTKNLETFFNNHEKYKNLGIPHCKVFMLHGIPGTGKSTMIHALASKYNYGIALFDFNKNISDKSMKEAFDKVPSNSFLVIEDIDCIFDSRKQHDEYKNNITFSGLLNALDGIKNVKNLIVFMTTNHVEKLDNALQRRTHHFIKFDYATYSQKYNMIIKYFPNTSQSDIEKLCKNKTTMNVLQKFLIQSIDLEYIQNIDDFFNFNKLYNTHTDCHDKIYT